MSRERNVGICEHCGREFGYYLIHNGFNDSSYAYCNQCGAVAILDLWGAPRAVTLERFQAITEDVEPFLKPCRCGGSFRAGAAPRCPHCHRPLSAALATEYIERNAPGTKGGWTWQRSWNGLYCVVIENQMVSNSWKDERLSPG